MAKLGAATYVCQSCGAVSSKWSGKCDSCNAWNSIIEEMRELTPRGLGTRRGKSIDFVALDGEAPQAPRRETGIGEFDRVTGGGLVRGSVILIGGDPGIGKSTLLLQIAARIGQGQSPQRTAYISGEEAVAQVQLRAKRLGLSAPLTDLASATNLGDIIATLEKRNDIDLAVIDSIQTLYMDSLDSAPGTVAQVRACSAELIRLAKKRGFVLILIGHVTKEGQIAGPRVLEHMVDTVLYFEGERGHHFRILRSVKNRFGPANEIGVFEMTDLGLREVTNPSALFLAERRGNVSGSAVFAGIEGTRPVLVEIQALVAPSPQANPRRAIVGWDSNRLSMILAVLESRCGLSLANHEVYLNVAGGLKISEPAADMAVALAIVSSLSDRPVPEDTIAFGEIGLSGEIRRVAQTELRMKEASKLGFHHAIIPAPLKKGSEKEMKITGIEHLQDVMAWLYGATGGVMKQKKEIKGVAHGNP